jgi:hypothetical protein
MNDSRMRRNRMSRRRAGAPERGVAAATETIHLLRSRANAARLLRSIKSADAGRLTSQRLLAKRVTVE